MSDMTIKQVAAAKSQAERDIEEIVSRFVSETGVHVTGMEVRVLKYEDIAGIVKAVSVRAELRVEVL